MLAIIDPYMPIWDRRVLVRLNLASRWDSMCHNPENAEIIYKEICDLYEEYMLTNEANQNVRVFDDFFPEYKDISSIKKIDYLLWSKGE